MINDIAPVSYYKNVRSTIPIQLYRNKNRYQYRADRILHQTKINKPIEALAVAKNADTDSAYQIVKDLQYIKENFPHRIVYPQTIYNYSDTATVYSALPTLEKYRYAIKDKPMSLLYAIVSNFKGEMEYDEE